MQSLQKQYKPILDFLHHWQNEWHLYDLMYFHSTAYYYPLEEFQFLKYFDFDLTPFFNDKFISFAVDGGGGHYCFWLYPELVGEPPILYFDGHGEQAFLASNLNDFVNIMINELDFCGGWICEGDDVAETFKENLWELVNNYQEEKGKEITEEEAEKLFFEDRKLFKEKASKVISFKSTKQIKSAFKKQPNFDDWINKVQEKNDALYKDKQSKVKEQSVEEQIEGYDGIVKDKIFSKQEVVSLVKSLKPELYKTSAFQEWMKTN